MVSQIFEKLVNNKLVDHRKKCGLFSDFQYDFRSSHSTTNLLAVKYDRPAKAFNMSETTRVVPLDLYKTFDRV